MKNMINSEALMTSKEISELVGKRHDNVKRTIEKLAKDGVIQHPQIEDCERINNLGFMVTDKYYRFIGEQGRRDSIVVVARLSPEFTGRMVDRWCELEKRVGCAGMERNQIQGQSPVDVVALACAVAQVTVSTTIKSALEALAGQRERLVIESKGPSEDVEHVAFDYTDMTRADGDEVAVNGSYLSIRSLSTKTGLVDSTCRRLVEFANIPAQKMGSLGLHVDSEAFITAACKLLGESEPPKGKRKHWQHPQFGGFTLRNGLPESTQASQG